MFDFFLTLGWIVLAIWLCVMFVCAILGQKEEPLPYEHPDEEPDMFEDYQ